MNDQKPSEPTPQFGTAEYAEQADGDHCRTCDQAISGSFYRINKAMTCTTCAEKVIGQLPKDTHKAFGRAILFGIGGAFLGLALYSVVGIVTGLAIGYVSLAVGYIVGKVMMIGSWGIGGRRYQVAAAAFTYAAVSLSAIPIGITMMIKERRTLDAGAAKIAASKEESKPGVSNPNSAAKNLEGSQHYEQNQQASLSSVLGWLVVIGLISPFLELASPLHGIIGLIILLVGMQIAWKTTAGRSIEVLGPFNV